MSYRIHYDYPAEAVQYFRSLKGKGGLSEQGLFIAEGEKIARKVLGHQLEIAAAYLTEERFQILKPLFEDRSGPTDIFLAPKEEMERVVGYPLHQGIMLAARIPIRRTLEEAMSDWRSPWMGVALDSIADAENMGGNIRNAAAFGAKAVIVDDQSCDPWLRRSVRVSMGTIVDVEIIRVDDLPLALETLGRTGFIRRIGASLSETSVALNEVDWEGDAIFVFGSEGWGLRPAVAEACDWLAKIPIAPQVDSLNVGVASGIFMNWFRRLH